MSRMKRILLVRSCGLAAGILALTATPALATLIELGQTKSPLVAPTCPAGVSASACTIILTQSVALETLRDGKGYPTTVKQAGSIVAFTVGLSILSNNKKTEKADIHTLDGAFGGTARAGIAVLKPVGKHRLFKWKVVAVSAIVHLQPYFGSVAQFVLSTPLHVVPGEVVGLAVPTWAPVLSIQLSPKAFAYRPSRATGCTTNPPPPALQVVGQITAYKCDYPGTRVEYSVTEITDPVATNPVH